VGVEHHEDIIADLKQALDAVNWAAGNEKAARRRAADSVPVPH
jgi:hypothetical protein